MQGATLIFCGIYFICFVLWCESVSGAYRLDNSKFVYSQSHATQGLCVGVGMPVMGRNLAVRIGLIACLLNKQD